MSRIPALDPAQSSGEARATLAEVDKAFGVTPNLFRVAAHSAAALNAMVQMNGALSKGLLSAKTRESIALAVAEANQCDYCLSAHCAIGSAAGLGSDEIACARDGKARDPKTSAILHFAKLVVANRAQISDADLRALKEAGVSDGEIAEVMGNIAFNVYTNYLNVVAGTDIDFPVVRAGLLV